MRFECLVHVIAFYLYFELFSSENVVLWFPGSLLINSIFAEYIFEEDIYLW